MLPPLSVFPDYYGMITSCDVTQSTGKSQNFQSSQLSAIICQDKTARFVHRSQNVDNSRVWDGNDIAGLEDDIVRSVAAFHQFVQIDGDRIVQVRRINRRGRIRRGIRDRSRG